MRVVRIALNADTAVSFVNWIAFAEPGNRIGIDSFVVFDKGALGAAA